MEAGTKAGMQEDCIVPWVCSRLLGTRHPTLFLALEMVCGRMLSLSVGACT